MISYQTEPSTPYYPTFNISQPFIEARKYPPPFLMNPTSFLIKSKKQKSKIKLDGKSGGNVWKPPSGRL